MTWSLEENPLWDQEATLSAAGRLQSSPHPGDPAHPWSRVETAARQGGSRVRDVNCKQLREFSEGGGMIGLVFLNLQEEKCTLIITPPPKGNSPYDF